MYTAYFFGSLCTTEHLKDLAACKQRAVCPMVIVHEVVGPLRDAE